MSSMIGEGGGGLAVIDIGAKEADSDLHRPDLHSRLSTTAVAASSVSSMASAGGPKLTVGRVSVVSTVVDCIVIVILGLVILAMSIWAEPFQRGFFCDDDSIRLSLKSDTITTLMLAVFSFSIPVLVVVTCEGAATVQEGPAGKRRRVALGRVAVPAYIMRAVWVLFAFLFGMAAQQVLVDSAKYTVGRLRPSFLAACQPSPPLEVLCRGGNATAVAPYPDAVAVHAYVTAFRCTGPPAGAREARLSFPSGHSSMAFYAAIFTVLFLERRFRWDRRGRLQLAFGQLMLVLLAWLTALSRISDHRHHWSDVLGGGAVGSLVAVLTVLKLTLCTGLGNGGGGGGGGASRPQNDGGGAAVAAAATTTGTGAEDAEGAPRLRSTPSCDTYETLFVI